MKYDEHMDQECIPLCDAINLIPGLHTIESCCGHGKAGMSIWLNPEEKTDLYAALYILALCINDEFGEDDSQVFHCHWKYVVYMPYLGAGPCLWLSSGNIITSEIATLAVGEPVYADAMLVAKRITNVLNNPDAIARFNLKPKKEENEYPRT